MGLFSKIFQSNKKYPPIDFSVFNADMHSHLIPGIDDGAQNIEDAIEIIKKFKKLGYTKLVTTPHVMSDYYKNTPQIILDGLKQLKSELKAQNIEIDITAAAEYNLDDGLGALIEKNQLLTFGKNYVLFELPFIQEPNNLQEIIFSLQTSGYQPVLAHPERYGFWYKNLSIFSELKSKGVLLQLNLLSLTGHYSPETKKIAEYLVDNDLIDFVASDCHRIEHLNILEEYCTSKYFNILVQKQLLNTTI